MFFKRLYNPKLAQASYLVGCQKTGEALVIDPNRDVDVYLEQAAAESLTLTAVTETHIHADFVSGLRELSQRAGATAYLSREGGPDWSYRFARPHDRLVGDGDILKIGNVELQAMHTPGHTPEHLTFLLRDRAASDQWMGAFTGDFLFVGDVGRPDLLEKAAGVASSTEAAGSALFRSLQRFRELPGYLQIWPAHGAGSACGKQLGAVPQSTLGYERLANWAFSIKSEQDFVRAVIRDQPEPPRYFGQMKKINRDGPAPLGGLHAPEQLQLSSLEDGPRQGRLVVDTRSAPEFAAGHIPGTLNLPCGKAFLAWAGWLLPYDQTMILIARDESAALEVTRDLAMIGLDRVVGYLPAQALALWPGRLQRVRQVEAEELESRLKNGEVVIVDVRGQAEWEAGHIAGARHAFLGALQSQLDELPRDRPLVTQCQSGQRSAIAASVLLQHGFDKVWNLAGGYGEWLRRQQMPAEVR
ncbi:MAG: MBL fold metallo-hydrolase [Armatimonadetes bacterium]|nr:MBL fold metallo-hydrolase [Armatimonadota bacterium]